MNTRSEHTHSMATVNGGMAWNQLLDARQEVCHQMISSGQTPKTQQSRLELMQSRLSEIDDALDRVASDWFGYCQSCGSELDEARLRFDPAVRECAACEELKKQVSKTDATIDSSEGLAVSMCQPFAVLHVETNHSSYRFLLMDPASGRSLVEGGKFFSEPTEATILGSSTRNAAFRSGWIGIGFRLEMWAADQLISTSAVSAVRVEHSIADALPSEVSTLHR